MFLAVDRIPPVLERAKPRTQLRRLHVKNSRVDTYDPASYRKHKCPDGWGSLCPDEIDLAHARELFASSVRVGKKAFNVEGEWAFQAQEHLPGVWHGHPIPWTRLPAEAWRALIESGRLDLKDFRRAIRKSLGSEFS